MIHVPVDMGSNELIGFIGHYEDKIETLKIIRDQSMDQYMVLLQFKTQIDADRFYTSINGQQFNSLLEERCQLAYVGKVEVLHSSEGAGTVIKMFL
jgi:BRCA1-associated protein